MLPDSEFVRETVDRMQLVGKASARRMFGGHGIFIDGRMVALIADNELYLKADAASQQLFESEKLPRFSYRRADGKQFSMSYYLAPDSFFEDPDDTRRWAQRAMDAAMRAPAPKKRKRRRQQ